MSFKEAVTSDEWMQIAARHKATASSLLAFQTSGSELVIYDHIGRAIEAALLAVVARRKRYNTWPRRHEQPELHGHRLRKIARFIGVQVPATNPELRGKFQGLLDWDGNRRYTVGQMTQAEVKDLHDAAFGKNGVYAWLRTL